MPHVVCLKRSININLLSFVFAILFVMLCLCCSLYLFVEVHMEEVLDMPMCNLSKMVHKHLVPIVKRGGGGGAKFFS